MNRFKSIHSEEQHQRLHTAGQIDFIKMFQPVIEQTENDNYYLEESTGNRRIEHYKSTRPNRYLYNNPPTTV